MEILGAISGVFALALSGLQELRHHRERQVRLRLFATTSRSGLEIPGLSLWHMPDHPLGYPRLLDPQINIVVMNPGKQRVMLNPGVMAEHRIRNPKGLLPIFTYGLTILPSSHGGETSRWIELMPGTNHETTVAYSDIIERMNDRRFLGSRTRIVFDDAVGNRYGSKPFKAVRIAAGQQEQTDSTDAGTGQRVAS